MKHIAKRRIKNTAQMLAVLGLVGMSTFGINAYAQEAEVIPSTETRDMRPDRTAHKQAIDQALTNNDYAAFKAAIANKSKLANVPEINEAVFAKMVEAHKLRAAGDKEGAQKIMTDLGFKKMPGMKRGHMHRFPDPSKFTDAQKQAWKEAHAILIKAGITMPWGDGQKTDTTK